MKKAILLTALSTIAISANAQTLDWGGETVVEATYGQKISSNGNWIVGFSVDGGTVLYNRVTGQAKYNGMLDYGKGRVVSDNGMVVGTELTDTDSGNIPRVMKGDDYWTPSVFNTKYSGNIHSITPDGTRVCGVVGNPGAGVTNLPFYCDVDAAGEFGEIHYLPYPDKDFFGSRPQFSTATWISGDGKTIAGQVIDARGFAVYPILYTQQSDGSWEISFPSEKLFNMNNLPLPQPLRDIEEMFPDAPYPELEKYMTPAEYAAFEAAGSPYEDLDQYMSEEAFLTYYDAVYKYEDAQIKFEEYFEKYDQDYWAIYDTSVFFVRNAMALSEDGKWLGSSAQVDLLLNEFDVIGFYHPYLCNLETLEWQNFGGERENYHVNQVLPGGVTVMNSLASDITPASTYLYFPENKKFTSLLDYLKGTKYDAWYKEYATGDVIVGEDEDGYLIFEEDYTFSGQASISEDFSVISGGLDGYILGLDQYVTYIFDDVAAGVETIGADPNGNGIFNVFNLQGVKVLSTKNHEDLKGLSKGIYIINGKKVMI